jgi:membrane fusion protein (multidrug efflux system)
VSAQLRLKSDQAKLDALTNGTFASQKATLESNLQAAQTKLASDQAKLDVINAGPTDEDIQSAQSAVTQAQQQLFLAQQPNTEQDIQAQRDAVTQAQQNLQKVLHPGAETDLAQQQAALNQQTANLEKASTPYTDADLQSAVAGVAQAEAQVAVAQANLDQTVIQAPFDGVISQRQLTAGAFASPQTPVATLVSSDVEIHVTVEEARVGQVRPGQDVQLSVPAYPGVAIPGKVVTIAPAGDPRAHTFDAKIVPNSQDQRLLAGMFAQVQLTAAQKPDAILVPRESIVQQADGPVVFVADNGRAVARKVQLGMSDDKNVEILSGVSPGEQVVVAGQNGLKDGAAVQVVGDSQSQGAAGGQGGQGAQGGQGQGGQRGQGQGQGQGGQGAQGGQGQGGQGGQGR